MMEYENIPVELKQLRQWVCAGADKVPINPLNDAMASVTNPATWASYDEAVSAGYPSIGFVLTRQDPYTFIDLDAPRGVADMQRQEKILSEFNTYIERSQSGNGYHIIVCASVPHGVRRDRVEIYSSERYMICTGNVVKNKPIADYTPQILSMFNEMAGTDTVDLTQYDSTIRDSDLLEMASGAVNGAKFDKLCRGEWQGDYPSQSEADFALLSMFAFYTRDNNQVARLFRMSGLGKREKAQRDDYLLGALKKIRSQQTPLVDIAALADNYVPIQMPKITRYDHMVLTPGLVAETVRYIYQSSVRPVYEVALAGAIGFLAAIAGRQYNISSSGLNQYLMLIAPTGTGKEGAASGIDRLVKHMRASLPMIDTFVGPAGFASGPALIKTLSEKVSFVSVLGEFGLTLQQLASPRAPANMVTLKQALLDLYQKSGWGSSLKSSVYSDREKNTKIVDSPALTLIGESTPSTFFENLSEDLIADGLIPRLTIIEYTGQRPPTNPNAFAPPPPDLIEALNTLATSVLNMQSKNICQQIEVMPEAQHLLDGFDKQCDSNINSTDSEVTKQLWNRAHLRALKLSGLLAVSFNIFAPVVMPQHAEWAIEFTKQNVDLLMQRFERGLIGSSDVQRDAYVIKFVEEYTEMNLGQRTAYSVRRNLIEDSFIIPYGYLRRRARNSIKQFGGQYGYAKNLENTINDLVKAEVLGIIPAEQAWAKYQTSAPLYIRGEAWGS